MAFTELENTATYTTDFNSYGRKVQIIRLEKSGIGGSIANPDPDPLDPENLPITDPITQAQADQFEKDVKKAFNFIENGDNKMGVENNNQIIACELTQGAIILAISGDKGFSNDILETEALGYILQVSTGGNFAGIANMAAFLVVTFENEHDK